jgi:hypothetical protein
MIASQQNMEWRTGMKKYANDTKLKKIDLVSKTNILLGAPVFHKDHKYTKNRTALAISRVFDQQWAEDYGVDDIEELLKFSDMTLDLDFFDNQKISEEDFCSLIENSA